MEGMNMNTKLTQDQLDQYQRDGALVYRNLMTDAEVRDLVAAIEDGIAKMGTNVVAGLKEFGEVPKDDTTDYYARVFVQRVNLWKVSERIKSIFLGAQLGEMVSRLAGVSGMRVWHDQTLQKAPWANPTAWHLDNPYWSFFSRQSISIWIALDDATIQNGCMAYIPGSHKTAEFSRNVGIGKDFGGLFKAYPEWAGIDPLVATMKRGDCGFHNGLTAHGAGPNMTTGYRRAMTCGYMPDGSTFNGTKNILPAEYFERLKPGDVLNNDELNPVVWKK
jgi:ectoine hydroxylase-related dioxygenase (phytanoyl-CoA dioxygenase family)